LGCDLKRQRILKYIFLAEKVVRPDRRLRPCDKLHGSVATYLRCGGVVNNQIRTGS